MKANKKTYRQGDVLLIEVDSIPKKSKKNTYASSEDIVLALGEATGNQHVMSTNTVEEFKLNSPSEESWFNADRFLRVSSVTKLRHEKNKMPTRDHAILEIEPKTYAVIQQCEWTTLQEIQNVKD